MNISLDPKTFSPLTQDHPQITSDYLLKLCGMMDSQAYHAAIAGFVLGLLSIVYFGRFRDWYFYYIMENLEKRKAHLLLMKVLDKLLLILMTILFALIIARMLRGE